MRHACPAPPPVTANLGWSTRRPLLRTVARSARTVLHRGADWHWGRGREGSGHCALAAVAHARVLTRATITRHVFSPVSPAATPLAAPAASRLGRPGSCLVFLTPYHTAVVVMTGCQYSVCARLVVNGSGNKQVRDTSRSEHPSRHNRVTGQASARPETTLRSAAGG